MAGEQLAAIAKVCHDANRAYCQVLGDYSQLPWEAAPEWQRQSAINGVMFHVEHPEATEADSHGAWMREKVAEGWTFGAEKNAELKIHPSLLPYEELPLSVRRKDALFSAVVRALTTVC